MAPSVSVKSLIEIDECIAYFFRVSCLCRGIGQFINNEANLLYFCLFQKVSRSTSCMALCFWILVILDDYFKQFSAAGIY